MEPMELMLWRRARKLKQADLATYLNVSRMTVSNWENGKFKIPAGTEFKLAALVLSKAAEQARPEFVTAASAKHFRPDLKLYEPSGIGKRVTESQEHPYWLMAMDKPIAWSLIDSDEYKDLVERWRAGTYKPPRRLPVDLTTGKQVPAKPLPGTQPAAPQFQLPTARRSEST